MAASQRFSTGTGLKPIWQNLSKWIVQLLEVPMTMAIELTFEAFYIQYSKRNKPILKREVNNETFLTLSKLDNQIYCYSLQYSLICIQSDLIYPDCFVSWNDVGLARYPDNGIESIKSDILSGANAIYVNKGEDVRCSRTRLSGHSKSGVPKLWYICLSEGVHLKLAIEGTNILTCCLCSNILYIFHLILFSKIIICLLLNISVKNHEKVFCHKEF